MDTPPPQMSAPGPTESPASAGGGSELYAVRLPRPLKERMVELQSQHGGRARDLFEEVATVMESRMGSQALLLPSAQSALLSKAKAQVRALLSDLEVGLQEIATHEQAQSASLEELERELVIERQKRLALEAKVTEWEQRLEEHRTEARQKEETLKKENAALKTELEEARDTARLLRGSLKEVQESLHQASHAREKLPKLQAALEEKDRECLRLAMDRENLELKMARMAEDLSRHAQTLEDLEKIRARELSALDAEMASKEERAKAQVARLEDEVHRLKLTVVHLESRLQTEAVP